MKIEQDEQAVKFLLGKLTEDEQVKLEEEFFRNSASFERLLLAENELIDAYAAGEMSSADRQAFESRLLLSPRQKQRVGFAGTLVRYASERPVPAAGTDLSPAIRSSWLDLLARFFSAQPVVAFSLAAVLIVLTGVVSWILISDSSRVVPGEIATGPSPAPADVPAATDEPANLRTPAPPVESSAAQGSGTNNTETARRRSSTRNLPPETTNKQAAPPKKPTTVISTVILPFGTTRSAGAAPSIKIPAHADLLRIRLEFEEGDFTSFFAVLETVEGQQVWRGKPVSSTSGKNDKAVTLSLPSHLLKKGVYILTLKGLHPDGAYETIGDYSFSVDR